MIGNLDRDLDCYHEVEIKQLVESYEVAIQALSSILGDQRGSASRNLAYIALGEFERISQMDSVDEDDNLFLEGEGG